MAGKRKKKPLFRCTFCGHRSRRTWECPFCGQLRNDAIGRDLDRQESRKGQP